MIFTSSVYLCACVAFISLTSTVAFSPYHLTIQVSTSSSNLVHQVTNTPLSANNDNRRQRQQLPQRSLVVSYNANVNDNNDTTEQQLKEKIRSLARGTDNGMKASESIQKQIKSCVTQLEELNPTNTNEGRLITSDPKLDGSWKLVYTTNAGSSAGKLGPFVGEVEQLICLSPSSDVNNDDDYYINYVRVGGNAVVGALNATWDVLSDDTWQVNFETIEFKLFGITLLEKDLEAKGIWRKTYLDEDFRILYASAVPTPTTSKSSNEMPSSPGDVSETDDVVKENIYILSK
jgi:hypothetical protein